MSCGNVANIKIEPVDVYWKGAEKECWDFSNATASGLGGKYVVIYNAAGSGFYVWFDENNTDVDPAPGGGLTAAEVNYAASASVSAIATAFEAVVEALSGIDATIDGTCVCTTRTVDGETTDSTVGNAGAYVSMTKITDGKDVYLGLLQGDVEATLEEQMTDITAHQSGATLRTKLRQGMTATIAMTLQESDNTLREKLLTYTAGGSFTPSGGTELFGWGDNKLGESTFVDAAKLILHPVNLADTDYTRDWCFWKAYPLIDTITFSGENPETMSISFEVYIDDSRPTNIRMFSIGDHTQAGITA